LTHQFNKELEFKGGLDLNHYKGTHFSTLHNLLGADGYLSFSDINRPDGFVVDKWFPSGFCPAFDTVDKTNHFYETGIQSGGINLQINYQNERLYSFIEASADVQRYERTDHFFYLDSDPAQKVSLLSNPGFTIQTGIRLHFAKYHFVHLRGGISSDQPYFQAYFPTKTNWENKQATNEKLLNAEFGYTIYSRRLKFEALAYYSQITNRSIVRRTNLNLGDVLGLINGVNETHQGIELKTSYKFTRNFQLNVNGSLGDWKYTNDPTAQLYDKNNQLKAENELWLKDLRIANAPQLKLFAEAEYRWANNFYVRLNYSRSEQMFAPFGVYDFKNLASRTDFKQWELPAVDLLGLSGNYLLSVRKSLAINLIFGAQNLLDTEYIEQTSTNMDEENVQYTRNQVFYGTGRTWFVGMKIQF